MKIKGTLTIDVWYDETDLDEVRDTLDDIMIDILKADLLGSGPTSAVNGPYVDYYSYSVSAVIASK